MNSIKKIAVIGLGYVGLPLALLAEQKGFDVTGIDLDEKKLTMLHSKKSPIDDETATNLLKSSKINFSNNINNLENVDAVIICVPTPVDSNKTPDLGPVKGAVKSAAKHMKDGSLLIIESTINPGVCDEVIIPLIESESKHKVGKTLYLAHCPERINPGDTKWHVGNINRVLGAFSETGLELAYEFYTKLVDAEIKKMGSLKEAEAVKVVENSFRDINIAFVNELAMSFDKLGINVNNVIDGAATKPFAFMAHYPGIGVGGHCIPVDPYYLIEYARKNGFEHKFLSLARNINESMPVYAINRLEEAYIQKTGKTIKGARVAVLGLSYKPNVGDDRESPSFEIIATLNNRGANITIFDPYFPKKSTVKDVESALKNKDIIIITTPHKEFIEIESSELPNNCIVLDGRNSFKFDSEIMNSKNILYQGIGI